MSSKSIFKNRYTSNKDYYSYRDYIEWIKPIYKHYIKNYGDISISELCSLDLEKIYKEDHKAIFALLTSYSAKYPVYYIDPTLLTLIKNTTIPKNININITNMFTGSAIFLYPKNNIFDIDFTITTLRGEVALSSVHYENKNNNKNVYFNDFKLGVDIAEHKIKDTGNEYINNRIAEISEITLQIFLYMSLYPNNGISNGTATSNGTGKGFKPSKGGLLTPQIIGLRESRNNPSTNPTPCPNMQGIKKQTHWRRGHWRQLDDGKVTWVRPCLINPE